MKQKFLLIAISFFLTVACFSQSPWVRKAYIELYNREPTAWEQNYGNYNGGIWSAYSEIKGYIQQYQESMQRYGLSVSIVALQNNRSAAFFTQNGNTIAADLITNDGGTIIAAGGGNIIAAGGGNIIAAGGGNVISPNGSNLSTLKGVSFGGRYQPQAVGSKIIPTSGKGALVIR